MSDYFDHIERELRAALRSHAHLPWYVRLRLRHSRALVVVLAGLIVAGPALAAAGVFQSGSPVAPFVAPTRTAGDGVAISSSVSLLALRTPDPAGGLLWGMRTLRTTRRLVCVQVGRVDFGTVGALGRDGAFANDGRFHPFSENYEQGPPCVTSDAHGNGYLNVAEYGVPTSGLYASGCRAPRSFPARLPAAIRLRIERRLGQTRQPVCPATDLRDVYYGLLGPEAISVTHRTSTGGLATTPTNGPDGAYLIVLPHHPAPYNDGFRYGGGPLRKVVRASAIETVAPVISRRPTCPAMAARPSATSPQPACCPPPQTSRRT